MSDHKEQGKKLLCDIVKAANATKELMHESDSFLDRIAELADCNTGVVAAAWLYLAVEQAHLAKMTIPEVHSLVDALAPIAMHNANRIESDMSALTDDGELPAGVRH